MVSPWYLEQIVPHQSADANIQRLCFTKNGILVNEFNLIFHDLFSQRGTTYKDIIHVLSTGMKTLAEIRQAISYTKGGSLTVFLDHLIISGFVTKHFQWSIKKNKYSRQSLYRLSDNYLRFYIKYIEPNQAKFFQEPQLRPQNVLVPGWETIIGYQVENLLLKNRHLIIGNLGIDFNQIVAEGPYSQKKTTRHKGRQIDYLIQTRTKNLFVCEFKYSRMEIKSDIIAEMEEKLRRLVVPRGYAVCPVLVHFSGVSQSIYDRDYFYQVIDALSFLDENNRSN